MIRLLVTGKTGQVATALSTRGAARTGIEVLAIGRPEIDLERHEGFASAIRAARPDAVVNAAAFTAVDQAESEEARATAINRDGAEAVARAAWQSGVPLIHLSTDYVYPGDKLAPYLESDATGPLGAYGRSKLAGEEAVRKAHPNALIFRTAWVYSPYGSNFVKSMLRLGAERSVISVVDDQTGNPTSALDIAEAILRIVPDLRAGAAGGTFHLAGEGFVTWCGFAREIFRQAAVLGGPSPEVRAITTADYPTPARRPANSRLDSSAFRARFGFGLRPWPEALAETLENLLQLRKLRT